MLYSCDKWGFILWLHITNTKWYDGSWDEPELMSILNAIQVCEWDSHTGDIDHKSYT